MVLPGFVEIFMVIFLGLVLGSFATALVWRVPRNISWLKEEDRFARSACPKCRKTLAIPDLVPVFSWIFLRGRCRYCKESIGWRYPVIEGLTLVACLAAFSSFGLSAAGLLFIFTIPFLVALLFIDMENMTLPNQLVLAVGVIGGIHVLMKSVAYESLAIILAGVAGFFLFGGISWALKKIMGLILKKEALGFGDVKFFAVAGLWLGPENLAYFMMLSGLLGLVFGLTWRVVKKNKLFPFGPALIVSFYILFVFGIPLYFLP